MGTRLSGVNWGTAALLALVTGPDETREARLTHCGKAQFCGLSRQAEAEQVSSISRQLPQVKQAKTNTLYNPGLYYHLSEHEFGQLATK